MGAPPENDPRLLLSREGAETLSTVQLLAVLLASSDGPCSGDVLLGRRLLNRFGHPARLDRATVTELRSAGLSRLRAARLKAALELGRRSLSPVQDRPRLTSSREVADYFLPRIGHREVERFCCALLDSRHRLIREVTVATGTVNACFIHPREIYRAAVTESACSVILVHNHPSGEMRPSEEDISLTRRIVEAGTVVGIRVLDHVIVGPGGHFSFLDSGLMPS